MAAPIRYPIKKLTSQDDYVQIDIYKYKPGGLSSGVSLGLPSGGTSGTLEQSIILPMPQTLPDNSQSAMWGKNEMGPVEIAAAGVAIAALNSSDNPAMAALQAVGNEAGKITAAAGTGTGQGALVAGFAGLATKNTLGQGGDAGTYLSRSGGITFNQNVELLFTGVDLRTAFAFNFDMVPRSAAETKAIKDIIKLLKRAMSPSRGNTGAGQGLFLTAPRVFNVIYKSGSKDHPFLNKFKTCALQSMSVNFTPDGTYTTYADATPVHIQMSLQFQELTPIFREDYGEDLNAITGVGY